MIRTYRIDDDDMTIIKRRLLASMFGNEQNVADRLKPVSTPDAIKDRLEYLREQIHAECISMSELLELQGLAEHIEPGDAELLEAAGVPEFGEER